MSIFFLTLAAIVIGITFWLSAACCLKMMTTCLMMTTTISIAFLAAWAYHTYRSIKNNSR